MNFYVIHVWGGVEITLDGPHLTPEARDDAARRLYQEHGPESSLHSLDVDGAAALSVADYNEASLT